MLIMWLLVLLIPLGLNTPTFRSRTISSGGSAEGEIELKLPSERSFADEYEVAYTTVRHAMAVLRERGIIVTAHGRGTFVTPRKPGSTQT